MKKENMKFMEQLRTVPEEMKNPITTGSLAGKGFTSINPSWRIMRLTEVFGPAGFGWWYEITDKHTEGDMQARSVRAFVDINLYVVDPDTKQVSHAIPGTGGADFVYQEYAGSPVTMNSDCYKAALTDAISVAAKALGVGLDVYLDKDQTRYDVEGHGRVYQEEKVAEDVTIETPQASMDTEETPKEEVSKELPSKEEKTASESPSIDLGSIDKAINLTIPVGKNKGKALKEALDQDGFLEYFSGDSFQTMNKPEREEFKKAVKLLLEARKAGLPIAA